MKIVQYTTDFMELDADEYAKQLEDAERDDLENLR